MDRRIGYSQSRTEVTPHCPSSPSPIAMDVLSAATAPPSSSLQSDALCLHNPTDALYIDTLFVSLDHRQILAGRDSRSQHAPAMKILISEWLTLRCQPLPPLNHRTPRRIHTPLRMSPTYPEHAHPRTPLTSSMLAPTPPPSSNTADHTNTPNSTFSRHHISSKHAPIIKTATPNTTPTPCLEKHRNQPDCFPRADIAIEDGSSVSLCTRHTPHASSKHISESPKQFNHITIVQNAKIRLHH
ncbi:hypothetical protein BLNAU_17156 [Blattamonas nauphoetae]|uniref:Uncharacterized protein n=1 Tax=Blattamonas nauphoetae TaxID=2049346 RepID=A0ABQ9X7R0_9EUKA|nr:hypothetical protein BLNAU_17156 [Blattamonas nauphoetae]